MHTCLLVSLCTKFVQIFAKKMVLDPLELKLLAVVNHPRCWTKHGSSVRAVSVIIRCATSAVPSYILLKEWTSLNHVQPMEDVQTDGKVSGNRTGWEEKGSLVAGPHKKSSAPR